MYDLEHTVKKIVGKTHEVGEQTKKNGNPSEDVFKTLLIM